MKLFDKKFAIWWAWVGVVLFSLTYFSGVIEPFLAYVMVTVLLVIPLVIMERSDD